MYPSTISITGNHIIHHKPDDDDDASQCRTHGRGVAQYMSADCFYQHIATDDAAAAETGCSDDNTASVPAAGLPMKMWADDDGCAVLNYASN